MCDHKYVHIETIKHQRYEGGYNTRWEKIDRFYCEKCLEQKEVKKEEYDRDKPEWY